MDQHLNNLPACLCPEDPDEAVRLYPRLYQKLTGFFQLRGVADPTVAADEALDWAAGIIAEGNDVPYIDTVCLRIARYIMREGLRHNTRESAAFLQFLEQHANATDTGIDCFSLMKTCFEKLPKSDTVKVPLDRDSLVIYLNPPAKSPDTTSYRIQWEDANGILDNVKAPVSHTLSIRIPAAKLKPGQYVLKLFEINRDRTEKRVSGGYYFSAVEK